MLPIVRTQACAPLPGMGAQASRGRLLSRAASSARGLTMAYGTATRFMTDSPDENALVAAAHALGYQILSKTPTECVVKVPTQDGKQVGTYARVHLQLPAYARG